MSFFQKLAPGNALRFLRTRKRYQVVALTVSSVLVVGIIIGFFKDSRFFPEYKPNIIYFQSWPLDRSEAEIKRQLKLDNVRRYILLDEQKRKQKERQQEFQQIDNTLKGWGI